MTNLSPHKRFPGPAGVEVPTEVVIHRPIPRRAVPLKGIKRLLIPDKPLHVEIGTEPKSSWDLLWLLRLVIFTLIFSPACYFVFQLIVKMLFYMVRKFESFMAFF
jgi:hypothetical protein